MLRGLSFTIAGALLLGVAAPSAAQVKLAYKFEDGVKSTTVVKVKTKQTLTLNDMPLESGSEQNMTITGTHGQRAADGTLEVEYQMTALKATVKLPRGIELTFDSADPDADPPGTAVDFLLDVFQAISKSGWTATYDKNNRVIAMKGRDDALDGLDETVRGMMKKQFEEAYLVQVANDELNKISDQPVRQGDTWERTNTVRLDSGQTLTFTTEFKYEGPVEEGGKQLEKISTKTTKVVYAVDADSPLKVLMSELTVAESSGFLLFDRQLGQVTQSSGKVQVQGDLKLEINAMEFAGKLDLTMENSSQRK